MQKSYAIAMAHFGAFGFMVLPSVASPWIVKDFPRLFFCLFVPFYAFLVTSTMMSWRKYKGCILTKLENDFRAKEGRDTYQGSCITYYIRIYLRVRVSEKFVRPVLLTIFFFPLMVLVGHFIRH